MPSRTVIPVDRRRDSTLEVAAQDSVTDAVVRRAIVGWPCLAIARFFGEAAVHQNAPHGPVVLTCCRLNALQVGELVEHGGREPFDGGCAQPFLPVAPAQPQVEKWGAVAQVLEVDHSHALAVSNDPVGAVMLAVEFSGRNPCVRCLLRYVHSRVERPLVGCQEAGQVRCFAPAEQWVRDPHLATLTVDPAPGAWWPPTTLGPPSSGTPQGLERLVTSAPQPATPIRPGRLSVGVIGTGRVGAVLAAALARVGHRPVAASAVSDASRSRAETLLPGAAVMSPPEVCAAAELVLVTVPDDQLPGLIEGLAAVDAWRPGQIVVHTSGRYGISVLEPAQRVGAVPLALHPVMTFTGTSIDIDRLVGASFGVTAPAAFLPIADALVLEMEAEPVHVDESARPLYHAALAHASNHLVTLVASSADLLEAAGIDEPRQVLSPLVSAALDNVLRLGDRALTGPVMRGDAATVARHIDEIGDVSPQTADLYVALARETARRAVDAGLLSEADADAVLDAIEGAEDER